MTSYSVAQIDLTCYIESSTFRPAGRIFSSKKKGNYGRYKC